MPRPKDMQRRKYHAAIANFTYGDDTPGEYWLSQWAGKIVKSRKWRELSACRSIVVTFDNRIKGPKWDGTTAVALRLPRSMRTRWGLLRALAYMLVPADEAWHGRTYCRELRQLAKQWLGRDAYDDLTERFKQHKVKTHRQWKMTDEQKAKVVNRGAFGVMRAKDEEELEAHYVV